MENTDDKHSVKRTNVADVLLAIVNGFFNLFNINKILCLFVLYMIYRDYKMMSKIPKGQDISKYMIDTNILYSIFANDNTVIIILGAIIVVLLIVIGILIFVVIPMYKKEIERIAKVRSDILHMPDKNGNIKIKEHKSSAKKK